MELIPTSIVQQLPCLYATENLPLAEKTVQVKLWSFENMDVWAFEWSEIISRSREELHLVRQHLDMKYKELSVSEYLRDNYPEVFADIQNRGGSLQVSQAAGDNGNGAATGAP